MNGKNTLKTSLTIALILVGLSTILALFCLNKYIQDAKRVDKLNSEVAILDDIKYASRDAVARVRGYIIMQEPEFLENYQENFITVSNSFTRLRKSFAGDREKLKHLEKIKDLVLNRYHNLELLLVAQKVNDLKRIKALTLQTLGTSNKVVKEMDRMEFRNSADLKKIRASQQVFQNIVIGISILSYVLSFSLLFLSLKAYKRADKEKELAYDALESKNKELFKLNNSLDEKVKLRTAELEAKNKELNLYAEHLKNSFEDLEVKVKFRTMELEKNLKRLQEENNTLKA